MAGTASDRHTASTMNEPPGYTCQITGGLTMLARLPTDRISSRDAARGQRLRNPATVFHGERPIGAFTETAVGAIRTSDKTVWVKDDAFHTWLPYELSSEVADLVRSTSPGDPLPLSRLSCEVAYQLTLAGIAVDPAEKVVQVSSLKYTLAVGPFRPGLNELHLASLRTYLRRRLREGAWQKHEGDNGGRVSIHNDPITRFYQEWALPIATALFSTKKIKPSYTYTVGYKRGDILRPHLDREACEYTIGIPIDYVPNVGQTVPWPLQISNGTQTERLNPYLGEVFGFRGRHLKHYRSRFFYGDLCMMLMMHYVNADYASLDE